MSSYFNKDFESDLTENFSDIDSAYDGEDDSAYDDGNDDEGYVDDDGDGDDGYDDDTMTMKFFMMTRRVKIMCGNINLNKNIMLNLQQLPWYNYIDIYE